MDKEKYKAIGIFDVSAFSNAVLLIDAVLKSANVRIVCCEKRLGGRLITIIIAGEVSPVTHAVEVAKNLKEIDENSLKIAEVVSNPHEEIIRVLNLK